MTFRGTRRQFLGAAALAAAPTAIKRPELGVLFWSAHSIIDATNRGDRIDKNLIAGWISHLAGHGVKSIFWRGMYVGKATYHSRVLPVMPRADHIVFAGTRYPGKGAAETLKEFNQLAAAVESFDDFDAARAEAKRQGLAFYADVSPFDKFFPGLEETFYEEHPDLWFWSRDQKQRLRGLPCYAEPMARERLRAEVTELINRGIDGISINLMSHQGGFKEQQPFGFNPVVIRMYKERWGGDIVNGDYDPSRLSALQGEIFTNLLTDVRRLIGPRRLSVSIPQTKDGIDSVTYCGTCKIDLDWRSWLKRKLVDDVSILSESHEPAVKWTADEVKKAAPEAPILLMRKVRDPVMVPTVTQELAAIHRGALEGLIVTEGRIFEPAHTKWCQIFE
jgi:hypothetical protein